MTVVTEIPPLLDDQQHIVLEGMSWDFYERLLRDIGARRVFVTYDEGRIEIMSPLPEHEYWSTIIERLIQTLTLELDMPIASLGSTTFKKKTAAKGLEPDDCFYLQNESRIRGKRRLDLRRDPPPDLAIEIDITHLSIPKRPIYAALRVPEIWHFDGERLTCLHLRGKDYRPSANSLAFPFLRIVDVEPFLKMMPEKGENPTVRAWIEWIRRELKGKL